MTTHEPDSSLPTTPGFWGLPRAYWTIWAIVLVNRMATFVQPFLILFLVGDKGLTAATAGLIATGLGVGAIASSVLGGWLGDRVSRRTAIVIGFLSGAASLVALALAPTLEAVWVAALAVGLSSDLARPAMSALVVDVVPPERRVRAFSMSFWAVNVGFTLATVAGGLLSRWGFTWLFLIDAASTLAAAALVWRLPRGPRVRRVPREDGVDVLARGTGRGGTGRRGNGRRGNERRGNERRGSDRDGIVWRVLRDPLALTLVAANTAYAAVYQQVYSTLPLAMGGHGLDAAAYGLIIAANGVVIVALQPLAGRYLERFRPERVFVVGLTVYALGFGATAWAHDAASYLVTVLIWSTGEVGCAAVVGALFAALAPPEKRAAYMALFSLTFSAGMAVGPVVGTTILTTAGAPALWWGCATLIGVMATGLVIVQRRPAAIEAPQPNVVPCR